MEKRSTTLTRTQLDKALAQAVRHPHKHVHKGRLILDEEVFRTPGRETNVMISRFALLDCTGTILIGPWSNIGARVRVYTHDHIHLGQEPLLAVEEEYGVLWQDKKIGSDVWIHDGSIILYQVTHIPDGVVVGAGSVLTKNPGPWEIWAGNPAVKLGVRKKSSPRDIEALLMEKRYRLSDDTPGVDKV